MDDVAHGENSSRDQTLRDSYVWKLDLGREGSNGERKRGRERGEEGGRGRERARARERT